MSGGERRRRAAEGGKFIAAVARIPTPATTTAFAAIRRPAPPFAAALPRISHPPDFSTVVVTHEKRSVRKHQETDRPPPARAVGTLPTDDEIIHAHRPAAAAVHRDAHDLGTRRHGAIPRPVQGDERVAPIPTVLRSPFANMRPPEPSRLNCVTAARMESRSSQRLQDEPTATYILPSGPKMIVRVE